MPQYNNPFALLADLSTTHHIALSANAPDVAATRALTAFLADRYREGGALYLLGPLGAGKTTVVQAIVEALGYDGMAKSPSFVLQHLYKIGDLTIEHWDLYRLADAPVEELVGVARELGANGQLVFVEWPEPLIALGLHAHADVLTIDYPGEGEYRHLALWEPMPVDIREGD